MSVLYHSAFGGDLIFDSEDGNYLEHKKYRNTQEEKKDFMRQREAEKQKAEIRGRYSGLYKAVDESKKRQAGAELETILELAKPLVKRELEDNLVEDILNGKYSAFNITISNGSNELIKVTVSPYTGYKGR